MNEMLIVAFAGPLAILLGGIMCFIEVATRKDEDHDALHCIF